ncbi:hypothetical protein KSF78_0009675 [Schistosoma japonicum]|nr:hypothetical protein KSF78_0009675 [Schistosoma japonicum]
MGKANQNIASSNQQLANVFARMLKAYPTEGENVNQLRKHYFSQLVENLKNLAKKPSVEQ